MVPCARVGETGLQSGWLELGCSGGLRIEAIYLANELRHLVDAAEGMRAGVRGVQEINR